MSRKETGYLSKPKAEFPVMRQPIAAGLLQLPLVIRHRVRSGRIQPNSGWFHHLEWWHGSEDLLPGGPKSGLTGNWHNTLVGQV